MLGKPSLVTRVAVGKFAGLAFGLAAFVALPLFDSGVTGTLRWGVLLWYLSLGAIIGIAGVVTRDPVLRTPLPWWLLAPWIGGWMNFVLALLVHDQAAAIGAAAFGAESWLANPFWLVAEGALVGLAIGGLAHWAGGEGKAAMDM